MYNIVNFAIRVDPEGGVWSGSALFATELGLHGNEPYCKMLLKYL